MVASSKLPVFLKLSIIGLIMLMGRANPMPSADVIFTVLIPNHFPIGIY